MSEAPNAQTAHTHAAPVVGVLMGSSSDWDVMKNAVAVLQEFGVPYEAKVEFLKHRDGVLHSVPEPSHHPRPCVLG